MPCECIMSQLHPAIQYQDCLLNMNELVLNAHNGPVLLLLTHTFSIVRLVSNCPRPLFLIGLLLLLVTISTLVFVYLPLFNACLDNLVSVVYDVADQSLVFNSHLEENLLPNLNIS